MCITKKVDPKGYEATWENALLWGRDEWKVQLSQRCNFQDAWRTCWGNRKRGGLKNRLQSEPQVNDLALLATASSGLRSKKPPLEGGFFAHVALFAYVS